MWKPKRPARSSRCIKLCRMFVFALAVGVASLVTRIDGDDFGDDQAAFAPDRNVTIGPCTWIVSQKCPDDENIGVYLFTRRNPNDRQRVHIDESWEKSNLSTSYFNPADPVKIIIHGYNADMFLSSLIDMKDEYLQRGNYNLFYIDWSRLAPAPCYLSAVHNVRHCGRCVADLVRRILESGTDDIHIIGFSLGAHVPNYVALNVRPFVLPRISGLDPAMPLFITATRDHKLDASDAKFVDVIHTNALIQGKIERCGHVDFYMNGGIIQPGCARGGRNPIACSHHRAPDYFSESIRSYRGFWGWACGSYISYLLGLCPHTSDLIAAGEDCVSTSRGMFLINTRSTSPFAEGRWTDMPATAPAVDVAKIAAENGGNGLGGAGDPLLRHLDEWGKLAGHFNNQATQSLAFDAMADYVWDEAANGNSLDNSAAAAAVHYPLQKKSQFLSVTGPAPVPAPATLKDETAISRDGFLALYHKLFGQPLTV